MTSSAQNHTQSIESEFALVGHAILSADWHQLQQCRKSSDWTPSGDLGPQILRQADEQTLTALAVLDQLKNSPKLTNEDLTDWGLIAAPRYLGRSKMADALQKFREEGAWGVSPHLIPHRSLHAVSGTLSQAFGIHGANFGVGGGPGSVAEAILLAGGLLEEFLPGVLVVMTGFYPEYIPDGEAPASDQACRAVALALRPSWGARCGDHLVLSLGETTAGQPELTLEEFYLAFQDDWLGRKRWRLPSGGTLQLDRWMQHERRAA